MLPRLVLDVPRRREPIELNRLLAGLKPSLETAEQAFSADDLSVARRLLARLDAGTKTEPTRKEAAALVRAALSPELERFRDRIVGLVLQGESVGWRRLWALWEIVGARHPLLASTLAQRLTARVSQSERFRDRLPRWVPRAESKLVEAIRNPVRWAAQYCESAPIRLTELSALGLALDLPLGSALAEALVRTGSGAWWLLCKPAETMAWVEGRRLGITQAVVERFLVEHGGRATGPHDVGQAPDLVRFASGALGDPFRKPSQWIGVSERAKSIMEWLIVADELGKILAEFAKHAERARAEFWQSYSATIRDALYYMADGTAVCMMVIKNTLVIEFGLTGNACYFYRAPSVPLRTLDLRGWTVPKFKNTFGLKLGSEELGFRQKASHQRGWQDDFRDLLSRQIL